VKATFTEAGHLMSGFQLLFFKHYGRSRAGPRISAGEVLTAGVVLAERWCESVANGESQNSGLSRGQGGSSSLTLVQFHGHGPRLAAANTVGIRLGQSQNDGLISSRVSHVGPLRAETMGDVVRQVVQAATHLTLGTLFRPTLRRVGVLKKTSRTHTMSEPRDFDVTWREDGTATVLARLTGRAGQGAATGVKGEGNWVRQADLSTIAYQVFDESNNNAEVTDGPRSVAISGAVLDTPETSTALWTLDTVGYNFLHDLTPDCFPIGGHVYRVEYKFVFGSGAVGWGVFRGEAKAVLSS